MASFEDYKMSRFLAEVLAVPTAAVVLALPAGESKPPESYAQLMNARTIEAMSSARPRFNTSGFLLKTAVSGKTLRQLLVEGLNKIDPPPHTLKALSQIGCATVVINHTGRQRTWHTISQEYQQAGMAKGDPYLDIPAADNDFYLSAASNCLDELRSAIKNHQKIAVPVDVG